MKSKITRSLLFTLLILNLKTFAQVQIGVIKNPEWNSVSSYDSRYGMSVELTNNATAMIVNVPKQDFAIVSVDDKLTQKWLTPLIGFPMAIGKFKNNILVIAASDHSYFKSFNNTFKAYTVDEKTGKLLSEKIIYDGDKDYVESPDFYFAKDGSFFKMSSRLTSMKRKVHVGLPVLGFLTALKVNKEYRSTQNFSIINFDDELNQKEKIDPIMPEGDTWTIAFNNDGGFLITTVSKSLAKLNVGTYISNHPEPLKTISIPLNFGKNAEYSGINVAPSKKALQNYIATIYKNEDKEHVMFLAKLDFNDGTFKTITEVLNKNHVKEIVKSYVPFNKKLDDIEFDDVKSIDVKHIEEFGDKILVGLASSYSVSSSRGGTTSFDGSVLLNVYDNQLKQQYRQFIPRDYRSMTGEGSGISFSLRDQNLRMLANTKNGGNSVAAMYCEMNINTGQMIKVNLISKDDLKSSYYANINSIAWNSKSFIIPYFEHIGLFSNKVDIQLQLLTY